MNSILRNMPRLAGAAGVAAAVWIVSPATAADVNATARQPAGIVAGAKTASASVKRHYHWPRYRLASWYGSRIHYADAGASLRHCYWFCGRPFVLMVGVAY
jgi:hypothetical protein